MFTRNSGARRLAAPLLALVWSLLPAANRAGAADPLRADLAAVPADAVGFVHVRVQEVWNSDLCKELRGTVLLAGDKALRAFDHRFRLNLSQVERVTVFALRPEQPHEGRQLLLVWILTARERIDREKILQADGSFTKSRFINNVEIFFGQRDVACCFPGDRTIAFGELTAMEAWSERSKRTEGPLSRSLQSAATGQAVEVAFQPGIIADSLQGLPPSVRPLAAARSIALSLNPVGDGKLSLRLSYSDGPRADAAEAAAKEALALSRRVLSDQRERLLDSLVGGGPTVSFSEFPGIAAELVGLGAIRQYDALLDNLAVRRDGDSLMAETPLPRGSATVLGTAALSVGAVLPEIERLREQTARSESSDNLKALALALHNYESAYGVLPPAAICGKRGKPLLSWRVAILPYVDGEALYRQFKLDEPWDSENNRKLIPLMPRVYRHPASRRGKPGDTYYRALVGGGAAFDLITSCRLSDFADSLSDTIVIVEAADSVPWTKPDDLEFDPTKPLPKWGDFYRGTGFLAAFADGHVAFLRAPIGDKKLRALVTRSGGEVIGKE